MHEDNHYSTLLDKVKNIFSPTDREEYNSIIKQIDKVNKMRKNNTLQKVEQDIARLQERKKRLEDRENKKIISILLRCNAKTVPLEILAGGILHTVRAYENNDPIIEDLKKDGISILHPGRGKRKY